MSEDKMSLEQKVQYPYYQLQSRTNHIKLFGVIEITQNHRDSLVNDGKHVLYHWPSKF